MIMLSLDAVFTMARNCWCALAAVQQQPPPPPPPTPSWVLYLPVFQLIFFFVVLVLVLFPFSFLKQIYSHPKTNIRHA